MAVYLDTSVVASMFVADAHSQRVTAWLRSNVEPLTLSDWTLSEFTSALATAVRAGRVPAALRAPAEQALNRWIAQRGGALAVMSEDVRQARSLINSTDEPLRSSDALHLAVAMRCGDHLASFDIGMRRAATDLGVQVEDL